MSYVVLFILAVLSCLLQHGAFATFPFMPDLPLALAAWAMIDGSERGVLIRAWMIGMVRDLIDPGSVYFHTVAYTLLAAAFLPARAFVFSARAVAWAGWAAFSSLVLALIDRKISGAGDGTFGRVAVDAILTGLAAAAIGLTLRLLPKFLSPVGKVGL